MLTVTIKEETKTIYSAKGDGVMDVLIAFALYSRDEDFDRAIRRAAYLLNPPEYPSKEMLQEMREVGAI